MRREVREEGESGVSVPVVPVWGRDPGIVVSGSGFVGVRRVAAVPGVWLVGAHGGAGVSTLARLSGLRDGGRSWPVASEGVNSVVVVARTHAAGLEAARDTAMRFYAGTVDGVDLLGVVLVADVPGRRLPRGLVSAVEVVCGAFPLSWRVGWVEELRDGSWRGEKRLPGRVARVVKELSALDEERKLRGSGHGRMGS